MLPDPPTIPTPVPKTDPPSFRKPLRLALLRSMGAMLRIPSRLTAHGTDGRAGQARRSAPRILLIRPDHLGDMLFVTPALRFLRAQMPQAHITMLAGSWALPVLERNSNLDAVETLDFPSFTRHPKSSLFAPYTYLWKSAQALHASQYDMAIMMRFDHWWGALLAALARIPTRIGYDVPEVHPFLTDVVSYESGRHEVTQNLRLVAHASKVAETAASPQMHPLEFAPADDDDKAVRALLQSHGIAPLERFAVLVPGSGAAVKLWRADGFARVAEQLYELYQLKVVVVGSQGERTLSAQIAAQSRAPIIDLTGMTTLAQLAALFGQSALAIGTDSGPMHLAVAMSTSSVHLFGPVSAKSFGPWGDPARHIVLPSGLACIPCNRLDYHGFELAAHPCVPLIAERQILAAVQSLVTVRHQPCYNSLRRL